MNLKSELCWLLARYAYQYNEEKPFTLASGGTSPEYLDCRQALSRPVVLRLVGEVLCGLLKSRAQAVGGLTMGADPIAVALSLRSAMELNWFSVRKEPKAHGRGRLIEGNIKAGDRVIVVDDVCTTGASTIKAIKACVAADLEIAQVIVLVDRQQGGMSTIKAEVGDDVPVDQVFTLQQIRAEYQELKGNPSGN